jgi:mitochondrial fission protein ELM1
VRRRFLVPTRVLHSLVNLGVSPSQILAMGYGLGLPDLPKTDIVVSAGGETLAANAAAARALGVPNIFCGRIRRLAPQHVQVILVSLERFGSLPNHLLTLPPSSIEMARPNGERAQLGPANPPKSVAVLIGGDSGAISYRATDWEGLLRFLRDAHQSQGVRWLVTTSRRSPSDVADALAKLTRDPASGIDKFVDYRASGPGTLAEILKAADAVLVTADSTTMTSEAVAAGLPVVGVLPDRAMPEEREVEYRAFLAGQGWYRSLAISQLTAPRFLDALSEVKPRQTSALDELASALASRLPQLFDNAQSR